MSKQVREKGKHRLPDIGKFLSLWGDKMWFRLAATMVVAFSLIIALEMNPIAGGSDSSGYMNFARLLSAGELSEDIRMPENAQFQDFKPSLFQPLGFVPREETGEFAPTYPIGLPLMLTVGGLHESRIGMKIAWAVIAAISGFSLWWLGGALGLRNPWRAYSVGTLVCAPMFLWSSLTLMTDALSTCQIIVCVCLCVGSKSSRAAAVSLGVVLAWAVLTRPSNVLFFIPTIVALLTNRVPIGRWALVVVGGIPGLLLWAFVNKTLYGSVLASGYGEIWALFKGEYFWPTAWHFAKTMFYDVHFLVLPTAVVGLLCLYRSKAIWVAIAWMLPIVTFFAFYFHSAESWWYLRFILPAFPAVILVSTFGLQEMFARFRFSKKYETGVVFLLLTIAFGTGVWWEDEFNILGEQGFEGRYERECAWAIENLPPNSIVVSMQASGALYYYTNYAIFRWDLATPEDWNSFLDAAKETGTPIFALLHKFEETEALANGRANWEVLADVAIRVRAFELKQNPTL